MVLAQAAFCLLGAALGLGGYLLKRWAVPRLLAREGPSRQAVLLTGMMPLLYLPPCVAVALLVPGYVLPMMIGLAGFTLAISVYAIIANVRARRDNHDRSA